MGNKRSLLLVVLFASLLPWFLQAHRHRQLDLCRSNVREISRALEMYSSDSAGRYPPNLDALVRSGHIQAIPTCPAAGFDNYSSTYHASAKPDGFSFGCAGRHHGEPSRAKTYPAWWDRLHSAPQGFPWQDSEVCAGCMDVNLDE
jgi:hypothetical protein